MKQCLRLLNISGRCCFGIPVAPVLIPAVAFRGFPKSSFCFGHIDHVFHMATRIHKLVRLQDLRYHRRVHL